VQSYFVHEAALTSAQRVQTDVDARRIAVAAVRTDDRGPAFVRFDDLRIDGPAAAGSMSAHTRAVLGPAIAVPMLAAAVGFAAGAIVLAQRHNSSFDESFGEGMCIVLAAGVGLGALAMWIALGHPRRSEVAPGKRNHVYVASDGSVHF
jgi:hypothetical protein